MKSKQYPVRFNNFCSDDDLNGPLFYMRVLQDFGTSNISERQMGHTLLNYVGERHGFSGGADMVPLRKKQLIGTC